MSADNTIGILVTRNRKGNGLEFRVAHVHAIENLEYDPDYPANPKPVLSRKYARLLFGSAPYFTDEAAAWRYALKLEAKIEREVGFPVEYGVERLDFSAVYFPASDRKRKRRGFRPAYVTQQAAAS
ncbi:MAG TPA: hypothetical protein VMR16_02715 [Candidatus Saccharimonadales bacterium]|nr:hypothetical protein [Candidatus Saccharimonadales bacterium]